MSTFGRKEQSCESQVPIYLAYGDGEAAHQKGFKPQKNTPFTPDIVVEELLNRFHLLQIVEYMGFANPKEHLGHFENAALLHQYTDRVKYRVFLTTLVGSTTEFYSVFR